MNKQKIHFLPWLKTGLLGLALSGWCMTGLPAQTEYQHYIDNDAQHYYDITVPVGYKYLYLDVRGADGGAKTKDDNVDEPKPGGIGANVTGFVYIGTKAGQIRPGSTLRLIPGQAGQSRLRLGGGGGGSGIAFKSPAATDHWQVLMVAGGGGGAGSNRDGIPGTSTNNGSAGGSTTGNGGKNGDGGSFGDYLGFPGGGIFSDGAGGCGGRAGFQNNEPVGGMGGAATCGHGDYSVAGGFGFGGGGAGLEGPRCLICDDHDWGSGGGGGGYSGGGGGYTSPQAGVGDHPMGGGGGGGSYANTAWLNNPFITSYGTTYYPQNGYVTYRFSNASPLKYICMFEDGTKCLEQNTSAINGGNLILDTYSAGRAQQWVINDSGIHLAVDQSKCLDLDNSNTADGTKIQLGPCNGNDAQKWIYDSKTHLIRSKIDYKKCIDLALGHVIVGNIFWLNTCNDNSPTQSWSVDEDSAKLLTGKNLRIHLVKDQGKCLDVHAAGSGTYNGSNIELNSCQTSNNSQYFAFDGKKITRQIEPNKCLDVDHSNTGNGTNIQLWDCNGTDAQNWIYDYFTKSIRSTLNINKCLDVDNSSTANGTNIQLYDCNGSYAQQFEIYY